MFQAWVKFNEDEKKMREHDAEAAALQAKMNSMLKDQNDKAKKVMDRMNAGNDMGLVKVNFTAWKKYLEEATKVDAVSDGRVAATPSEAAESEYVDDMVSTDTQELDWD